MYVNALMSACEVPILIEPMRRAWGGDREKNDGGVSNPYRFRGRKNYCNKGFPCGGVHPSRLFPPACACLPRGGVLFGREGVG
jgi:hypothetical protein